MLNFELKVTSVGLDNLKTIFTLFPSTIIVGYSLEGKGLYLHKTLENCIPLMFPLPLIECAEIVYKWVTKGSDTYNSGQVEGTYIGQGYHIDTRPSFENSDIVLLIYPTDIIYAQD